MLVVAVFVLGLPLVPLLLDYITLGYDMALNDRGQAVANFEASLQERYGDGFDAFIFEATDRLSENSPLGEGNKITQLAQLVALIWQHEVGLNPDFSSQQELWRIIDRTLAQRSFVAEQIETELDIANDVSAYNQEVIQIFQQYFPENSNFIESEAFLNSLFIRLHRPNEYQPLSDAVAQQRKNAEVFSLLLEHYQPNSEIGSSLQRKGIRLVSIMSPLLNSYRPDSPNPDPETNNVFEVLPRIEMILNGETPEGYINEFEVIIWYLTQEGYLQGLDAQSQVDFILNFFESEQRYSINTRAFSQPLSQESIPAHLRSDQLASFYGARWEDPEFRRTIALRGNVEDYEWFYNDEDISTQFIFFSELVDSRDSEHINQQIDSATESDDFVFHRFYIERYALDAVLSSEESQTLSNEQLFLLADWYSQKIEDGISDELIEIPQFSISDLLRSISEQQDDDSNNEHFVESVLAYELAESYAFTPKEVEEIMNIIRPLLSDESSLVNLSMIFSELGINPELMTSEAVTQIFQPFVDSDIPDKTRLLRHLIVINRGRFNIKDNLFNPSASEHFVSMFNRFRAQYRLDAQSAAILSNSLHYQIVSAGYRFDSDKGQELVDDFFRIVDDTFIVPGSPSIILSYSRELTRETVENEFISNPQDLALHHPAFNAFEVTTTSEIGNVEFHGAVTQVSLSDAFTLRDFYFSDTELPPNTIAGQFAWMYGFSSQEQQGIVEAILQTNDEGNLEVANHVTVEIASGRYQGTRFLGITHDGNYGLFEFDTYVQENMTEEEAIAALEVAGFREIFFPNLVYDSSAEDPFAGRSGLDISSRGRLVFMEDGSVFFLNNAPVLHPNNSELSYTEGIDSMQFQSVETMVAAINQGNETSYTQEDVTGIMITDPAHGTVLTTEDGTLKKDGAPAESAPIFFVIPLSESN